MSNEEQDEAPPVVVDPRPWPDRKIQKEFECYGSSFEDDRDLGAESICMATCLVRDRCIKIIARRIPAIELQANRPPTNPITDGDIMEAMGAESEEAIQLGRKILPMMERNAGGHITGKWKEGIEGNPIEQFLPPQAEPSAELLEAIARSKAGGAQPGVEPDQPVTKEHAKGGLSLVLGGKSPAPAPAPKSPPAPAEPELQLPDDTIVVDKVEPNEEAEMARNKKKAPARKKAPAKKKGAKKKAAKKRAAKAAPARKTAATKRPAKKKAAAKKKAPARKKAPAKKKAKARKKAKATARRASSGESMSRFDRERARSPKVAALKVGTVLDRVYEGKRYKVTVKADHYLMSGKKYETLYSTIVAIAGTSDFDRQDGGGIRKMAAWSSPKFWKL